MKKILSLAFLLCLAMMGVAQNTFVHHNAYFCNQNYWSVLTPDENIIMDENIFDDNLQDVGLNFLKVNKEGQIVDSLFIDDVEEMLWTNMLARNTLDGGNVYLYFSANSFNSQNYYNAIFFSDDMEITDRIRKPLDITGTMKLGSYRHYMEENGTFLSSWRNEATDTCWVARFDLDGNLLNLSEPFYVGDPSGSQAVPYRPWAIIQKDPMRIGLMTYDNYGVIYIYIFDSELNMVSKNTVEKMLGWKVYADLHSTIVGMEDGYFAIFTNYYFPTGQQPKKLICKFNINVEPQGNQENLIKIRTSAGEYPQPMTVDKKDGGLYVTCYEKPSAGAVALHVKYFSSDLKDELWDKVVWYNKDNAVLGFSANPLDDGGIVMTGFIYQSICYYQSNVFASFIDNYESLDENQDTSTPFHCYPNPAFDVVNISFSEGVQPQLVEVYSIDGRKMTEQNFNFSTVNLSILNAGVYLMKITLTDGRTFTERVVVGN